MSYIFGGDTGISYEEMMNKRKIAERLAANRTKAPQTAGGGLSAIGEALLYRKLDKDANKAEKEGRDNANSAFGAILGGRAMGAQPTAAPQPSTPQQPTPQGGGNANSVRAGLIQRGMPEHVADAFVMNFKDESGLNPGINEHNPIVPGSRGGFGLAQWTGPRRKQLEAFAQQQGKPVSDQDVQLDFLMTELQGSEKRAAQSIFGAKDTGSAAVAIVNDFLRPAEEHRASRSKRYMGAQPQGTQVAQSGAGVEQIMAAMSNPYMKPEQKQALGVLLQQQMQANDPMRKLQMQNMQGQIDARNKPDPMAAIQLEKAQLELDRAKNPQANLSIQELSDGRKYYVDPAGKVPPRLVNPDMEAGGKDMTESERRIFMFNSIQNETSPAINKIEDFGFDPSNVQDRFADGVLGGNWAKSQEGQMYDAAAGAWSEGALRLATGAAATPEEHTRIKGMYFAQAGDSLETIKFKRAMRESYQGVLQRTLSGDTGEAPNPLMFMVDRLYGNREPDTVQQPSPASGQAQRFEDIDIMSLSEEELDALYNERTGGKR